MGKVKFLEAEGTLAVDHWIDAIKDFLIVHILVEPNLNVHFILFRD